MSAGCVEELQLLLRSGWRLVAFESFEEERALAAIERVARSLKRACLPFSVASGLAGGEGAGSLDAGLRALAVREEPAVFVVLDAHRLLDDALAVRRLRDLLPVLTRRRQALVLLGPVVELPLELVREAGRVALPLPGAEELRTLLARVLEAESLPEPDAEPREQAVRGALGLTAAEAARVFRKALRERGALDAGAVTCVVREKRGVLRRNPALCFCDTESRLEDVGGLGELKRWLFERRRAFGEEARAFGLPHPRGLLLLGVQGCGKSLCAKAVAHAWRFPLLRLDLAAAFATRVQSPEAAMREATQVAESIAPAVLWIDEIEKGFAASAADPSASRVFGAFLTWLSEKQSPVFVVATANDVAGLPPELLRRGRFDDLFFVDLPSDAERAEILSIHLERRGRDPKQFRLDDLAAHTVHLTGAELEQVVSAALYGAFAASRDLQESDLLNAASDTVPLYDTYEERIKELRDWARGRARPASGDRRLADLFREG